MDAREDSARTVVDELGMDAPASPGVDPPVRGLGVTRLAHNLRDLDVGGTEYAAGSEGNLREGGPRSDRNGDEVDVLDCSGIDGDVDVELVVVRVVLVQRLFAANQHPEMWAPISNEKT